ncbi:MAG: hypothetical protein DA328_08335 [Nitrososphaeraceae archaeon]|nr:hypothetical protein [Nitrososphaeraceae archaeon]
MPPVVRQQNKIKERAKGMVLALSKGKFYVVSNKQDYPWCTCKNFLKFPFLKHVQQQHQRYVLIF